jgi:hypothetical protein
VRSNIVAIVAIATLTAALALAFGEDDSQAEPLADQALEMQIRRGASEFDISGQTSSDAHEVILRDILELQLPTSEISIDFRRSELPPPGWALLTELGLRAVLLTRFSESTIDSGGIVIRGVTDDPVAWNTAVKRLQSALLPGMQFENRVIELKPAPAFANLCRKQFAAAISKGPLEFAAGQAEIESDAQALLDSLNETAADCPSWHINVRVGGDGVPGNDAEIADARAQSIVAYLTERGLPPNRISVSTDTSGRVGRAEFSVSM